MLRRCLSCYTPFEPNQTLEGFPAGRRVAFDPARGRLWAICPACSRWSLAPFETRWETLESLERLTRGPARLLKRGEQISLFESGDLEIVRIGRADLREESWWRYGSAFLSRRLRARRLTRLGKFIDGAIMLVNIGIPYWGHSDAGEWIDLARRRRFGRTAWRGLSHCPACGDPLRDLLFRELSDVFLRPDRDAFALWYSCRLCGADDEEAGHRLSGLGAEHVLRRTLAFQNFAGGTEAQVGEAMSMVGAEESPESMVRRAADDGVAIGGLPAPASLAVEIALNSGIEAKLLEEEVADIERRWREEEELAAIIDGELTPIGPSR